MENIRDSIHKHGEAVKDGITKRLSTRKKKKTEKGYVPELSEIDLNFIAEHTSINKEDVSATYVVGY